MTTELQATRDQLTRADELREYLLSLTIAHAVKDSKFYRSRFEKTPAINNLADLKLLPLLHKNDLVQHLDDMRTFAEFPDYLMYTSGTTGEPLEVPVYQEEIDAYNDLVLSAWRRKFNNEIPLTMAILRVGHGSHVLMRQIPTIPCHINYGMEQLITMLETSHWVAGRRMKVSNLETNVLNLRQITNELLEQGIDPKRFGLETISVSGWYMTQWERRFIQDLWGITLLDRYGVTEVHGDSKWCHACEHYHFDFTVIPEVLDLDTGEPIKNGIGQLILTGLFPFNQAVPKIRYVIGDLVEIRKTSCGSSEPGVRFLSRLKDAVPSSPGSKNRYLLFSTDVADALSAFPDVARKLKTGFLKFRLSSAAPGKAVVEVELTYPPEAYPNRVAELTQYIKSFLQQRTAGAGEIELEFFRPGQLKSVTKV